MFADLVTTCQAGHEFHREMFARCPQCTLVDIPSPTSSPLYVVCTTCAMQYDPDVQEEDGCPRCGIDRTTELECEFCGDLFDSSRSDNGLVCDSCVSRAEDLYE